MTPATMRCEKCSGEGITLRSTDDIRKLPDGSLDPHDLRRRETCDRCGGSGVVPQDYAGVREKAAGNIADQI